MLIMVRLDDPGLPAGPATVIKVGLSLAEYQKLRSDRDGAHNPYLRLWRGFDGVTVGQRVASKQLIS